MAWRKICFLIELAAQPFLRAFSATDSKGLYFIMVA